MLHLLSADHRTHGLDVIARLGSVSAHLGTDLLAQIPHIAGVVVLGTCNRLALLLDAPASPEAAAGKTEADVQAANQELVQQVADFLAKRCGLSALTLCAWHGKAAVAQLFATAAGLESMVVGEREIAGQLRRAMILAHDDGTVTGALARAIEAASATSRLVASSTSLAGTGRSVVAVGLDLAAQHLPPLPSARVLLIGTGAYAGASVSALHERGVRDIEVYSRSKRAQAFAQGRQLRAVPDAALPAALQEADLVLTCRGLGTPVLTHDLVETAVRARQPQEPNLVVLDLALARDVEKRVGSVAGVTLIDLAAVQRAVPQAQSAQVAAARALVAAQVEEFCRRDAGRHMDPLITALRAHVDDLVEREVGRLRVRDEMVSRDEAALALHRLAARLLHHPCVAARRAGEAGRDEEYLAALPIVLGREVTQALSAGMAAPEVCPAATNTAHSDKETNE